MAKTREDEAAPSGQPLFYSNHCQFDLNHIPPLRRSTAGLYYSAFRNRDNRGADGHFRYQGRTILYKGQKLEGRRVVIFFDEEHRIEEDPDYLDRVDSGRFENYTLEGYHAKTEVFGMITLIANTDKTAQQLYEACKTRCEVEQAPAQMIKKLSRVLTVYASGKWDRAEMTKKETDLMAEIGWDIT